MKVLVICGGKKTGKTTLICRLIQILTSKGYRIGSIKHDGHEFDIDNENRDNVKHYLVGAQTSCVFSSQRMMVIKNESLSLEDILEYYSDLDLVIVEGCKNSSYAKLEILRQGFQEKPMSNQENRLGLIADFKLETNERLFDYDNMDQIVSFIEKYFFEKRK